jgi:hypothetical protein
MAFGVAGTLPRIVLADSVDSVDVVCAPVGSGLLKEASSDGDKVEAVSSSLMGDTRRVPNPPGTERGADDTV